MLCHETPEWKRYLSLREQRPAAFRDGELEIITDPQTVDRFCEKTGSRLGVLCESPYYLHLVDLVRKKPDGEAFAYERLLPAVESGAVVAVPVCQGRFVLLRQYRHALREQMLGFPRGFGEKGLCGSDNLSKELHEEIGTETVENVRYLGTIAADSGILGTKAEAFSCEVRSPHVVKGYEGIESVELLDKDELAARIAGGEIKDGYTLAAFALYSACGD